MLPENRPILRHALGGRNHILAICLSLLALQLAVDFLLPQSLVLLPSGILLMIDVSIASFFCYRRARQSRDTARILWALIGSGESILLVSYVGIGIELVFVNFPRQQTAPSDFLFFLIGIPVMLAIAIPTESAPMRIFYWLDGLQITLLLVFIAASIFGSLPFIFFNDVPVPGFYSVAAFSAELFLMAVGATLRMATRPEKRSLRNFWPGICVWLWGQTLFDSIYNFTNLFSQTAPFRLQILLCFSSLLLAVFAATQFETKNNAPRTHFQKDLALFLDNGSPVIYPALVVLLAISTASDHLRFSLTTIAISLLAYGVRSTVLLSRFQKIQFEMEHRQEKLEHLTLTDTTTGIANRRNFDRSLKHAWMESRRDGKPYNLLIIDVDFFKMLNDTYGHAEGDRCLRSIAFALRSVFREEKDLVARFGGEEFAAIVSEDAPNSASTIARRMQKAVEALELRTHTPIGDSVTISIGIASSANARSEIGWLQQADAALYEAKRRGRNRIVSL